MELDPQLKQILDKLDPSDDEPVELMSPSRARTVWKEEMAAVAGSPLPVKSVSEHLIPAPEGSLKLRLYKPDRPEKEELQPVLVYYHGGGWIRGDLDTHDDVCRYLCHHTPCIVAAIDYRLSPEYKFPKPLQDCYTGTRWVANHAEKLGADPSRLAIGGDSAGGNFACAVSLMARDCGEPQIMFQLLIYPVTDLASETESKRLYSDGYLLNSLPFYIASYIGDADPTLPLASPLRAPDLSGLPRACVITAGFDPLRDEGNDYAIRLKAAGVPTEHQCYESMIHGFVSITGLIDSAEVGLRDAAAALNTAFTR